MPSTSVVFISIFYKSQFRETKRSYSIRLNYDQKKEVAKEISEELIAAFNQRKIVTIDLGKYDPDNEWNSNSTIFVVDMNEVKDFNVSYTTN
ncbi:hypothetical protein Q8G81_32175, partial [Klebsiella pneumoniae]